MREIKFRAWHPLLKRMFYDCCVSVGDWTDNSTHYGGEHNTLMQYTGLKDKNGKEIYEGDIVDFGRWDEGKGERATVEWSEYYTGYAYRFFSQYGGEGVERLNDKYFRDLAEVIGNIYENSELLDK